MQNDAATQRRLKALEDEVRRLGRVVNAISAKNGIPAGQPRKPPIGE
jgi:vacuolar-type H+-ATPase subunit D/Vma8